MRSTECYKSALLGMALWAFLWNLSIAETATNAVPGATDPTADLIRTGKAGDPHYLSLLRGQCLLRAGKMTAAPTVFEDALKGDPKHRPAAFAALADIAFQQTNWVQTTEWADRLAGIDAATAYGVALKTADPALAAELQFRIGLIDLEQNRPGDAVTAFRRTTL
jgi:hypothetical protein